MVSSRKEYVFIVICSIVLVVFDPEPESFSPAMVAIDPVEDSIEFNMKPVGKDVRPQR